MVLIEVVLLLVLALPLDLVTSVVLVEDSQEAEGQVLPGEILGIALASAFFSSSKCSCTTSTLCFLVFKSLESKTLSRISIYHDSWYSSSFCVF